MSYVERRIVISDDVGTGQILQQNIGAGQIVGTLIASGTIFKQNIRFVDLTTAPLPNTPTVVPYGITFTDTSGNPINPLGGAYPTTGGVAGFVQEAARSATAITLVASVSGVVARISVFG